MFVLDFKNWLESCGTVPPPAELTNDSLGVRSKYVASKTETGPEIKNPFISNTRRKKYGKRYGNARPNNRI